MPGWMPLEWALKNTEDRSVITTNNQGFCTEVIQSGSPVTLVDDPDDGIPKVTKYDGVNFGGIAIYNSANIDLTKEMVPEGTLSMHSKFPVAVSGFEIVLPIIGSVGDFIRPRKDGSWKVGCKRKRAVGRIMQRCGMKSIVRLL